MDDAEPVTVLLQRMSRGDVAAEEQLFAFLYGELRARPPALLARRRARPLHPTNVVNEAGHYQHLAQAEWEGR
jgi:hypothetical protein